MRHAEIRIIGQGLAGTLLAWACEAAGIRFHLIDPGHAMAASRIGAGIINPITGQRLVKSWRVDELLGPAEATYRTIEEELGEPILRRLRVRRELRTARERETFAAKRRTGELEPYVRLLPGCDDAFIIEPAFHVNLARLIHASRERWLRRGVLAERSATAAELAGDAGPAVACLGAAEVALRRVPLGRIKGELLHLEPTDPPAPASERAEIRNDGHWLLPLPGGGWAVGATYDRMAPDLQPSGAARCLLLERARRLLGGPEPRVHSALAGWRTSARTSGRSPAGCRERAAWACATASDRRAPCLVRGWRGSGWISWSRNAPSTPRFRRPAFSFSCRARSASSPRHTRGSRPPSGRASG